VLHLGQLNLQLAFVGSGALGKNVKDQSGPINHAPVQGLFQIALLSRAEAMINENDLGAGVVQKLTQLVDLANANQKPGIHLAQRRGKFAGYFGTGRQSQRIELQLLLRVRQVTDTDVHENSKFAVTRAIKQDGAPRLTGRARRLRAGRTTDQAGKSVFALVIVRQYDSARRHYGGNRVLVDHLADAVLQQHHKLVE
jgi:hypothetical protein